MWIGEDLMPQLNDFLANLNIALNKPKDAVRALARKLWGSRGVRYWLLTDSDPNERTSRPRLDEKDPIGVNIFKCKTFTPLTCHDHK